MKNAFIVVIVVLTMLFSSACNQSSVPTAPNHFVETENVASSEPETTAEDDTEPETTMAEVTEPATTEPIPTEPMHSPLYIPEVPVEDVITYFNEVCLDSEFVNGGDPSVVQKWTSPIRYTLEGDYTDLDVVVLNSFEEWLNAVEGFPGISRTTDSLASNLRIHFCDQQEFLRLMGPGYENLDGAVTFWYENNQIYDAIICCLTDLDQQLRNSVILEEVYNGLGPVQDTLLRPDSLIYQEFSQPQWLSDVDELILRLLYHPDIQPGMNAQECEQIIRSVYY